MYIPGAKLLESTIPSLSVGRLSSTSTAKENVYTYIREDCWYNTVFCTGGNYVIAPTTWMVVQYYGGSRVFVYGIDRNYKSCEEIIRKCKHVLVQQTREGKMLLSESDRIADTLEEVYSVTSGYYVVYANFAGSNKFMEEKLWELGYRLYTQMHYAAELTKYLQTQEEILLDRLANVGYVVQASGLYVPKELLHKIYKFVGQLIQTRLV